MQDHCFKPSMKFEHVCASAAREVFEAKSLTESGGDDVPKVLRQVTSVMCKLLLKQPLSPLNLNCTMDWADAT